jgi:uncharacterized protein (DUF2249 family)
MASKNIRIDARLLLARGQEPCAAVEAAIAKLSPGQGITVVAPFMPAPLIEKLKAAGFVAQAARTGDGWQVDFRRD